MKQPTQNAGFWAKTSEGRSYHPLVAHSADVAAMLRGLLEPGSVFRQKLEKLPSVSDVEPLTRTLVYFAALHDLGKANHGFQDKAGPWERPERAAQWCVSGHVGPVLASFSEDPDFKELVVELLSPVRMPSAHGLEAFITAICHHGQPLDRVHRNLPRSKWKALWAADPDSGRDPRREILRLSKLAGEWSGIAEIRHDVPWSSDISNLFAGLLTLADWLGSNSDRFPPTESAEDDPTAYWLNTVSTAESALGAVGLISPRPPSRPANGSLYATLFPAIFHKANPTPLQELIATLELPPPGSRIVVEAETGSGKTEAVLALYFRLRAAGQSGGLVFALPTRATAAAMHDRVLEVAGRLAHPEHPPTIALAMGGQLSTTPRHQMGSAAVQQHPDVQDRPEHRWASESTKTYFGAEIVVGTVDQILLAGLPVRHAHLRLGLLTRHLIVVDELHAYDRYMNGILANVIDFHSRAGGMSIFVSATLSRSARLALTDDVDASDLSTAESTPYPLLSVRERSAKEWTECPAAVRGDGRVVHWSLRDEEEAFEEAILLAREGARVSVLRNTVGDARRAVSWLQERAGDLLWQPCPDLGHQPAYHSRYTHPDRLVLDQAALRDFGKTAGRGGSGMILVSTQVVEQSLDVDFDWMLTDLAPIDVLLQRIGRLHRHGRQDRSESVRQPRVRIHAPAESFEPSRDRRSDFGWGTVYRSWLDLELTRQLVAQQPSISIPLENRRLVEAVYHAQAREAFVSKYPEWSEVLDHDDGVQLGHAVHASLAALQLDRSYPQQAQQYRTAREESIRTRLGDDRIEVFLDRPASAWYSPSGQSGSVALSLKDLRRAGVNDLADPRAEWIGDSETEQRYQLGEKGLLVYSPAGWGVTT